MTRLLIDENMSPQLAASLRGAGHDAVHVNEVGLHGAPDSEIMLTAAQLGRTVVTHDQDFVDNHRVLGSTAPSVIKVVGRDIPRLGLEGVTGAQAQSDRLQAVLPDLDRHLDRGATVTLDRSGVAIHPLPLAQERRRAPDREVVDDRSAATAERATRAGGRDGVPAERRESRSRADAVLERVRERRLPDQGRER